jgi:hypothetical protein
MRPLKWVLASVFLALLGCSLVSPVAAQTSSSLPQPTSGSASYWDDPVNWKQQFVPDSPLFWDDSRHWTTNYGPAYRDTMILPTQMLACTGQFALCFHSGPEPYPCTLSPDGRSADCKCMVLNTTNYTLLTAILNYPVYQATFNACGQYGAGCLPTNKAPVCKYLQGGALIPGADIISTYDPQAQTEIVKALNKQSPVTTCPKGPFAACMTAPCTLSADGSATATCKCPVFNGRFTLQGEAQACSLTGGLIPSASYIPLLDPHPNQ